MTDLSYLEELEKRANLLQELFEEDSQAYKEFIGLINDFRLQYQTFGERVKKLEDTVYTLVRMMKQRSDRDGDFLESLENAICSDSHLRADYTGHSIRVCPDYDQTGYRQFSSC